MSTLVWDLVQLQRLTGTRAGKLLQLTPAKLDRTGDAWQYNVDGHKTVHHGHFRIVTIGRRSQEILSPRLMELSGTDHEIRGNWGTHHLLGQVGGVGEVGGVGGDTPLEVGGDTVFVWWD